jgi:16S rRNA (guanine527-N7)-methyltransferase
VQPTDSLLEVLERFEVLLLERAIPLGLVSKTDSDRLWERHILDSVRAVGVLDAPAASGCDIGSGAGLPGIPIAIARPSMKVVLAERRRTRAAFLEMAVEELRLPNVIVHAGSASAIEERFDLCFARALASPVAAWTLAADLLLPGGRLVLWSGIDSGAGDELPIGVPVESRSNAGLAHGGALVIMTKQ